LKRLSAAISIIIAILIALIAVHYVGRAISFIAELAFVLAIIAVIVGAVTAYPRKFRK
jgi:uncharacterized Tic20 family protein